MSLLETAFTRHARRRGPADLRRDVPVLQPRADRRGVGGRRDRRGPADLDVYVHKHDLRAGLRLIRARTDKPIGFNAIVEKSSRVYEDRMRRWIDVALEEGVRFFVTALGDPRWVVDKVHAAGGVVYHDVTERKWADKALAGGVDGLIAVNATPAGTPAARAPRRCATSWPISACRWSAPAASATRRRSCAALELGYAGVQLGTRFIATRRVPRPRRLQAGDPARPAPRTSC